MLAFAAFFVWNFISNSIKEIVLLSEPDKVAYFVGDELDPQGLIVKAVYKNGSETERAQGYYISIEELDAIVDGIINGDDNAEHPLNA